MHWASSPRVERHRPLLAVLVVAALTLTAGRTQTSRDADLDRIRDEIGKLKNKLEDVHRRARSAEQELESVDLELGIRSRELELAIDAQAQLDEEKGQIEAQVATLGPQLERQKQFLSRRLAALYRMGGLSYLKMFLSVDERRDPLEAVSMLSFLVSRDARAVSQFQAQRQQLSRRQEDLATAREKLAEVRSVVEDRQRQVEAAHAEKQRLLAALQKQEHGSAQQLAGLEEKARRLERLLDVLARQQSGDSVALDVRTVQGALPWPVTGKVAERFGRQRNPVFDTVTTNNGIKIATEPGAPVRAVYQGTVLFTQWFKGYGNLIILDHGHRVFSLYGNLKAPTVAVGDAIAGGQTMAGVGESEDPAPGFLYFEIRQDNHPEDPQKWLR